MPSVFVDTSYWIAIFVPRDQHHQAAKRAQNGIREHHLVTTEAVLNEFLSAIAKNDRRIRQAAARFVWSILDNTGVEVVPASSELFHKGLEMYNQRADKTYSCVDCMSMIIMKERNITDVLTSDGHFSQESFVLLMTA